MGRGASILNTGLFVLDGAAKLDDSAFRYGYGDAGLVHNTGTLRKTGTGSAVGEASVDNDGVIEVLDGRLELPELLNWSGSLFGGTGTLAGGAFVVGNGAALVLPGALKANAARLALGAGSQVLYNELTGTGPQARDGLTGLLRNAAGGALELSGGRSLTVAGTFVNQGVLALGAGSTLNAGGFTQAAGAVLRPTVTAASAGRVAVTGAAQLAGRLDTVAPAPVNGDIAVVTGAVAGTFGAVTGDYVPTYGAGSRDGPPRRRGEPKAPAVTMARHADGGLRPGAGRRHDARRRSGDEGRGAAPTSRATGPAGRPRQGAAARPPRRAGRRPQAAAARRAAAARARRRASRRGSRALNRRVCRVLPSDEDSGSRHTRNPQKAGGANQTALALGIA